MRRARSRRRVAVGSLVTLLSAGLLAAHFSGFSLGEIGSDLRISQLGQDGDDSIQTERPDTTYNSLTNEYLVVWSGTPDFCCPLDPQPFGQLIDAATGLEVGQNDFWIEGGPPEQLDVVYNSAADEYFMVGVQEDAFTEDEEIFGQRLDASGGGLGTQVAISEMNGVGYFGSAGEPAVVYNPIDNRYLVLWEGYRTDVVASGEEEIWGQFVTAAGDPTGADDFRISETGTDGDDSNDANRPKIAHNPSANEYLVVWNNQTPLASLEEEEVWGQLLDNQGNEIGTDFRISDMGPDGDPDFIGHNAAVAWNPTAGEYLVVWKGLDGGAGGVQVYGQRLNSLGQEVGVNDFQISELGAGASAPTEAVDVVYQAGANEYVVVWDYEDFVEGTEIFGRRLDGATATPLEPSFEISEMGPDGNDNFHAQHPSLALASAEGEYLAVWQGNEGSDPLHDDELEVWGQRLGDSGDADAPTIQNVGVLPPSGPPGTEFVVRAVVSDPSGVDSVQVILENASGVEVFQIGMGPEGGDRWTVTLQSDGVPEGVYAVHIEAVDIPGNSGRLEDAAQITIGGELSCDDVALLRTRCIAAGASARIQAMVVLADTSHDGEIVTVDVDGLGHEIEVSGSRARLNLLGATSGLHTVELVDPPMCVPPVEVTCP